MTGIVLAYNRYAEVGLIEDENDQRIKYFGNIGCQRGDFVEYDIETSSHGLVAKNIKTLMLNKNIGVSLSLCSLG